VTFLVKEKSLSRFIDFGSGLPTCGNVHEHVSVDARIVHSISLKGRHFITT